MPRKTTPQIDRLMAKVEKSEGGCWLFTGALSPAGYGVVGVGRRGESGERLAHRISYLHFVGPIPEGCEIDHRCSVRNCLSPDHLHAVTHQENVRLTNERGRAVYWNRAKTHCPRGHEYNEANTYWRKCRRKRLCRACMRDWGKARDGEAHLGGV